MISLAIAVANLLSLTVSGTSASLTLLGHTINL
jgi:hypothetical protein